MRQFNEKDYELVNKYEADFRRAIDSRYAKGITREAFDEISQVYRETLNRQANSNCGGCVLQMLTSVGRLYFAYKGKMEEELKKKELEKKQNEKTPRKREKKDVSQKGSNRRSQKNTTTVTKDILGFLGFGSENEED